LNKQKVCLIRNGLLFKKVPIKIYDESNGFHFHACHVAKIFGQHKGIAAQPQLLNLFAFLGGWGETHRATDFICL
jgi:hypothetical protein